MIDVAKAKLDPTSEFHNPMEVVDNTELLLEDKLKILKQWEYDARQLELAEDENMASDQPDKDTLDQVLEALHLLDTPS